MIALAVLPIFVVLGLAFYCNRPRCWTCKKRKFQMNFTDKLDCIGCYMKHKAGKK